jgi:hypothetical protein
MYDFWNSKHLPPPSTERCLGCDKKLNSYWDGVSLSTPRGKYMVCCSRGSTHSSIPKTTCFTKAVCLIARARMCAGCGESISLKEGGPVGGLCDSCRKKLKETDLIVGQCKKEKNLRVEETKKELLRELFSDIVIWFGSCSSYERNHHRYGDLILALIGQYDREKKYRDDWHALLGGIHGLLRYTKNVAYKLGFEEGSSMLRKLNSGEMSLNDFDGRRSHRIYEMERSVELQKNAPEILRSAIAAIADGKL